MIMGNRPHLCGLTSSVRRSRGMTTSRPRVMGRLLTTVRGRRESGRSFGVALPGFWGRGGSRQRRDGSVYRTPMYSTRTHEHPLRPNLRVLLLSKGRPSLPRRSPASSSQQSTKTVRPKMRQNASRTPNALCLT